MRHGGEYLPGIFGGGEPEAGCMGDEPAADFIGDGYFDDILGNTKQAVERVAESRAALCALSVDFGCGDLGVAKQFLNEANINSILQ